MAYRLTKKEMMKEIVKCGKDPVYFIDSYSKITHPQEGLIPFRLFDYQKDLLKSYQDHRFNVILKARQLGISTVTASYIVWMMLFHREKNILVVATKLQVAANLVKKVKLAIKSLPDWLRIADVNIDNRNSFELTNGSLIRASSTSGDAGRSEALSLLVVDEAAHVEGMDDLWTALYSTLSTGGRCIALSSPNGVGNWFHKAYTEAEEAKNDFYPTKLLWDVHPNRDADWYEKETRNMSRRDIAQELECSFNMSGETVFHGEDIRRILEDVREPKHKTGFDRNLWIWEEYQQNASYLLSADVARGDSKDYSVYHIIKLETMEIVAEYQGKITPDVFSRMIHDSGREYGNCLVVVENNSVGFAVLDKLIDFGYPNIYHSIKSTHEYVDQLEAESRTNSVAGFTTSVKTRPLIIAKMEEFVRNKLIIVYSSRLLNEMKTFVWNHGKAQAMRSYNDDLVMACAVACWVRDTALVVNKRDLEYKKVMLDSMIRSSTTLNTTIKGMNGYKGQSLSDTMREQKKSQVDFPWLFRG
jgi:hypothetical protein